LNGIQEVVGSIPIGSTKPLQSTRLNVFPAPARKLPGGWVCRVGRGKPGHYAMKPLRQRRVGRAAPDLRNCASEHLSNQIVGSVDGRTQEQRRSPQRRQD
jgi:hypothetical protein